MALPHLIVPKHAPFVIDLGDAYTSIYEHQTEQDIRHSSQQYGDAQNEKERVEIVQQTGIQYSELHHLPYFEPSCFVVVDAMHNIFLGLVQEHYDNTTPVLNINIPVTETLKLNRHKHKSIFKLIKMLESPISHELITPDGYNIYFKQLLNLH
ncbi:hypothetical protein CVT25_008293 [Psilocybe cyanescens]|uniref:Uncharacterized protein n=1 Tax=Psilocybe cyanescens TaxID=93625 RepID=A0A409X9D5_PSICY|nr:hypothetical protein CVT25_008293 [Psilocybe cyanescens]